jgi:selenocysteine-specific elongation factor
VRLADVGRGDWIVADGDRTVHAAARRPAAAAARGHVPGAGTPVHLHHGCRDVMARVRADRRRARPGPRWRTCRDEPLPALHGDRFILRDSAAARTLGGGVVLDPFAEGRRGAGAPAAAGRAGPRRAGRRAAGPAEAPGGVDLDRLRAMFNLTAAGRAGAARGARRGGDRPPAAHRHHARPHAGLGAGHARLPAGVPQRASGVPRHARGRCATAGRTGAAAVPPSRRSCTAPRRAGIAVRNGVARLAEHDVAATPATRLWEAVYPLLRGAAGIAGAVPRTPSWRRRRASTRAG